MSQSQREHMSIFCRELWIWFRQHKRKLPWRDVEVKDPTQKAYLVLVSEIMLQQTQVPRVIILYKNFIQTFPSLKALSDSSTSEILMAWRGLGYNSRALRLREAAKTILRDFHGTFPQSMDELQSIKGIGPYTAAAIRNFAFGIPTPCVDTNIRRILHRFFVGPENSDGTWEKNDAFLLQLAEKILPIAEKIYLIQEQVSDLRKKQILFSADWHAALMDFGSSLCTKNNVQWDSFPTEMKPICLAFRKEVQKTKKLRKKEPGREVGSKHIPNRIFRGKIVEALRDHPKGLTAENLGPIVALDWTMGDHREWLDGLLHGLIRDKMIAKKKEKYVLG